MSEICTDNRFEVIAAYKKKLMESTNIETSPDEMAVIDNVLFRFWQMGWLPPVPHGRLIDADALSKSLDRLCDRVCQYSKAQRKVMCGACPLGDAFAVVEDDVPTIIPEEEGET